MKQQQKKQPNPGPGFGCFSWLLFQKRKKPTIIKVNTKTLGENAIDQ